MKLDWFDQYIHTGCILYSHWNVHPFLSHKQGNIPDFGEDDGGDVAPADGEGGNNAPTIPAGGGAQG